MGCGAFHIRTSTSVEECPDDCRSADQASGSTEQQWPDNESADGVGSLSPCPSVHTVQSQITSIASIPSFTTGLSSTDGSKRYKFLDDLRSDVPTIAETIADMQDFQDLPTYTRTSSITSFSSSCPHESDEFLLRGSQSANCTPRGSKDDVLRAVCEHDHVVTNIDTRMHPLAVMCRADGGSSIAESDFESCNPAVGDLASCSDVPSIRDDMSVTSGPSDICVSFPPSTYSDNNGSSTPTRERMQALVGLGRSHSGKPGKSNRRSARREAERNATNRSDDRDPRGSPDERGSIVSSVSDSRSRNIKENPLLDLVTQSQQRRYGGSRDQPLESACAASRQVSMHSGSTVGTASANAASM